MLARVPLRLRLTAAYAAVIAVVLAATGLFLYLRLAAELDATIDQGLRTRAGDVSGLVGHNGLDASSRSTLTQEGENLAQVLDRRGRVVDATPTVRARPLLTPAELLRARNGTLMVDRERPPGEDDPARLLATAAGDYVVVVGAPLDDRRDALNHLLTLMLVGGPAAILLASLAGYGVAAAALRPVETMRRRAAAIGAHDPGERLPVPPGDDEMARLGETLNGMLERLEAALERERTLVSDASHELRTPLAILKTELELALRRPRTAQELEQTVRAAAEQADHLTRLAEDLLVIAQSDQGRLPVRRERIAVAELFGGLCDRFGARISAAEPGGVSLDADPLRLAQALGNLVDNAFRHGAQHVELGADSHDGHVDLHVRDDGPGFPEAFLASAFERFTRADAARTGGGAGLGLAIVDAIARAHGGSAGAANRAEGGADVWVRLPA